ncbi:hypothetical protein TSUD_279060 [Trifolium subterraneum]|uniref:Negative regulator of systemic acquired resistance SNI1 n=1 Tax=Trifolium subterraneum TaxID=3900 RepID=A0A2Z6NU98_TRISU|nr:hypothetical protein TSUD_279060 [Trifolium subterraneum]
MKNPSSSNNEQCNKAAIEDNMLLTMFDSSSDSNITNQDALDERIGFLDAVRGSSIGLQNGKPPTSKIFGAVFHMLRTGNSIQLIVASYMLLVDLEKHFPRAYLSGVDDSLLSSNSPPELVVAEEAWSPLIVGLDNATAVSEAGDKQSGGPLDPSSFHLLIEELAETLTESNIQATSMKPLQNLLLFQYLVIVLESDFLPRNVTMNWSLQRESLLNMLLVEKNSESQLSKNCHTALSFALLEVLKNTRVSVEKLLVMIMALDTSRKKADIEGHTSRADGPRTPLVDIILDDLAYNKDSVPHFLKIFSEPKSKLEIVVQYLWKYITKPSTRTRRSNGFTEDTTFEGALKCFSNNTGTKSIIKKIGADVVQLLLAHGFQAQLSILSERNANDNIGGDKEEGANALVDLCQTFISAFDSLRSTDRQENHFSAF